MALKTQTLTTTVSTIKPGCTGPLLVTSGTLLSQPAGTTQTRPIRKKTASSTTLAAGAALKSRLLTLTASLAVTMARSGRVVLQTLTATASTAPSLTRLVAVTRSVTAAVSPSRVLLIKATRLITAAVTVTSAATKVKVVLLSTTVSAATSIVRLVAAVRSVTVTATTGAARRVAALRTVTAVAGVLLQTVKLGPVNQIFQVSLATSVAVATAAARLVMLPRRVTAALTTTRPVRLGRTLNVEADATVSESVMVSISRVVASVLLVLLRVARNGIVDPVASHHHGKTSEAATLTGGDKQAATLTDISPGDPS